MSRWICRRWALPCPRSLLPAPGGTAPFPRILRHHNLDEYLHAYIDGCSLADDRKVPLFRTIGRVPGDSAFPLPQASAYQMLRLRAAAARIMTAIATIPRDRHHRLSQNGGTLERAAVMASTLRPARRSSDDVTIDEVGRVII